jgi:acyl-[acyl carrier protein]--UDP-N-acetylglucosamine O-acyltransferase
VPDVSRRALAKAFRVLFRHSAPRSESLRSLDADVSRDPYVMKLVEFLARSLDAQGA